MLKIWYKCISLLLVIIRMNNHLECGYIRTMWLRCLYQYFKKKQSLSVEVCGLPGMSVFSPTALVLSWLLGPAACRGAPGWQQWWLKWWILPPTYKTQVEFQAPAPLLAVTAGGIWKVRQYIAAFAVCLFSLSSQRIINSNKDKAIGRWTFCPPRVSSLRPRMLWEWKGQESDW